MFFQKPKKENKETIREKAKEHNEKMISKYKSNIDACASKSKVFRLKADFDKKSGSPEVLLEQTDSVSALFNHSDKSKLAVLNFASYKNPGGGFLRGSTAQEESLCNSSFLYNVLCKFSKEYEKNKNDVNNGLYRNFAIVSPDVKFFQENNELQATVITCPAPNISTGVRFGVVTEKENSEALEDRISFIRDIISGYDFNLLVLGAFGCGVFAQDAEEVGSLFKKYFSDAPVETIIYAVPDNNNFNKLKKGLDYNNTLDISNLVNINPLKGLANNFRNK